MHKDLRLTFTCSGLGEELGDGEEEDEHEDADGGGVMGSKMGARSFLSCGVHRS